MSNNKKVYFVGAGCGAADLITVRGSRLLAAADIVVYTGSLINPELLDYTPEGCILRNSAHMNLDEIIDVISRGIRAGKTVVRLHTGDPSLYGAIREQIDRLSLLGISSEICPGVSSFCGAAASLNAEYTLPGISQTLIITRRGGRTPVPDSESLPELGRHGSSMAIFLSASMSDRVSEELIVSGGYNASTPCAVVYKASWSDEKKTITTLGALPETMKSMNTDKTALILVGDFLRCGSAPYKLSELYSK